MAIITLNGSPMHTSGNLPTVGSKAPDFIFTKNDLGEVRFEDYKDKTIILNIFPSLDTSTCAAAMQRFNEIAASLPDALILCVSADLPFAQKRFCTAEHLKNVVPVSVFRHPSFGKDYGVLITDGPLAGLLSRAVVVINEQGQVTYTQQVKELSDEPNYSAMLAVLN